MNQLEWIYPKWYCTDYYGNENLKKEKKIGIVGEDFINIIYGVFSILQAGIEVVIMVSGRHGDMHF